MPPAGRVPLAARVPLAGRVPGSAVMFGPHVTNLGDGRTLSDRHVAYYRARAEGGAGVIVTETASVHPSDHPYERAPLASACADGWGAVAAACRPHGALVLAGLGHRGLQGSSAHHRAALWGPSAVPDPATREMPAVMEPGDIRALVAGFADAAAPAVASGCDGVEIDAGPRSLLRQFLSDITNHRDDAYGADRALLLLEVLAAARAAIGDEAALALRLSCDECTGWGGITPASAAAVADRAAPLIDLLTVVRGGLYSVDAYRPPAQPSWSEERGQSPTVPGFNGEALRTVRAAVAGRCAVALQGSVVDPALAQRALDDDAADLVEMTRAQIADPHLVARARVGAPHRPCLLCNQACMVDDPRNPVVDCVVRPAVPGEAYAPGPGATAAAMPVVQPSEALVLGAGVAGLAAARALAEGGVRVTVLERAAAPGGVLRAAAVARPALAALLDWLEGECARLGVLLECGVPDGARRVATALRSGTPVIQATGGIPRPAGVPCEAWAEAAAVLGGAVPGGAVPGGAAPPPGGPLLVHDPIGGPAGVAVAEWLAAGGHTVHLVTPDPVAGAELARAGDLVGANVRLARAGVTRHVYSVLRGQRGGVAVLEHRHTGERTEVPCALVVDCAPRLPGEPLEGAVRAGDCVAPRTALEAMREGEAAARAVLVGRTGLWDGRGRDGRGPSGNRQSPVGSPSS